MPSTFFGLTIASSGLNAAQAQINTTANNISNVNTEGYSRQVVNVVASSALRAYQKYGTTGTGVTAESVTQCRDLYYDTKYWNNQSNFGFYDKKLYYMNQIEGYFSETAAKTGFSTVYSKMFNSLSTLQTNPADASRRNEFINNAQEMCTYFNSVSTQLSELQVTINDEIKTTVDEINSIAEKVAILNKQINVIEQEGGHANELRDQRASLIDTLSQIMPVEIKEREVANSNFPDMYTGATYYTVTINGQLLVDNYDFNTLACKARAEKYNQCDVDGLYDIVWEGTDATFNATTASMSGSLKAMFDVRDGNNTENMKGYVTATSGSSLTINHLSIKSINELNMPSSGTLFVNNRILTYDGFSFETDENGAVTAVTFNMTETMTSKEQTGMNGKFCSVGTSVDFMGVPYYQNQMSIFLRNMAESFNDIETSGVDLNNNPMETFFIANSITGITNDPDSMEWTLDEDYKDKRDLTSESNTYYQLTAATVGVADKTKRDPSYFASTTADNYSSGSDAHDLIDKLLRLESDTIIFRGGGGSSFLQCIYSDVTVDTQECTTFSKNYENIEKQIQQQRMSISGVDEDDEALDLVKFQNAYNLSSKCISVFTEIYDRLILQTGV